MINLKKSLKLVTYLKKLDNEKNIMY
jgi:hypothetical protein